MVQVIETNIQYDNNNQFQDFQSRVIEVDKWEDLIEEIKQNKSVFRLSSLGWLHGVTIPREVTINNLQYDEKHMSCDLISPHFGYKKKLCYLID